MSDYRRALKELEIKVRQQEDTITQLVEILAATNRRISELSFQHGIEKQKILLH